MDGTPVPAASSRKWVGHGRHHDITRPHRPQGSRISSESPKVSVSRRVDLDGSEGEGGGQILRSALSLAMLTGRPFRMVKVRANRAVPGLRAQHLAAVEAAAALCGAEVRGAAVGSRELSFRPGPVAARDYTHQIGTAGASTLVLQAIYLPLALRADRPVRVAIEGGTFNTQAPSFPFLKACWQPLLGKLGLPMAMSMPAAGFYPQGGGRIEAWIEPAQPRAVTLVDRGPLEKITGTAGVCRLDRGIAQRLRDRAVALLADRGLEAEIDLEEWTGRSPGAALSLTAHRRDGLAATFVGLGERGKPAERVAQEAVAELLAYEESAGALDLHSADQVLLPLAFAEGRSEYTVAATTEHLRSNARTIAAFLDREITVIEPEGSTPGRVLIAG